MSLRRGYYGHSCWQMDWQTTKGRSSMKIPLNSIKSKYIEFHFDLSFSVTCIASWNYLEWWVWKRSNWEIPWKSKTDFVSFVQAKRTKVLVDAAIKQFDVLLPDERKDSFKNALKVCQNEGQGLKDVCEFGFLLTKCFQEKIPNFVFPWFDHKINDDSEPLSIAFNIESAMIFSIQGFSLVSYNIFLQFHLVKACSEIVFFYQ